MKITKIKPNEIFFPAMAYLIGFNLLFLLFPDSNDFVVASLSEEVVLTPDNYQTDQCVTVTPLDDSVYEELEYFAVSLSTSDECLEFKEELILVGIANDDSESLFYIEGKNMA